VSVIYISDLSDKLVFSLSGDVDIALKDRRMRISLKRLKYIKTNNLITIPYEANQKSEKLNEIRALLKKFNFQEESSKEISEVLEELDRSTILFKDFSEQARSIRNNEFHSNKKLENQFIEFHKMVSKEFIRTPKDFQWLSSFHMAFSQNSCNFSVPGSGKTAMVYATYAYLRGVSDEEKKVDKLVVIGPKSSFPAWEDEYLVCFGKEIKSQRIFGDIDIEERKRHLASGNPAELTLISHHSVPNLTTEIVSFINNNRSMVVIDEAHKIKNINGKNALSILKVAESARSRIVLTGTPLPNGYEDLFNLFKFIYPYQYKNILRMNYPSLVMMTKNDELDSDRVNSLINNISPFFIRVKKSDLGLPNVREKIVYIKMDEQQRDIYDFIEDKYVASFRCESSATIKDIFNRAKLIRLRQASTNPSLLLQSINENIESDDSSRKDFDNLDDNIANADIFNKIYSYKNIIPNKFIAIHNLITKEIVAHSEKVIIWTIFIKNAELLKDYLSKNGIESKLLLGYISQDERESTIRSFNDPNNNDFHVVIANPFTVAESISLHKGCHNAIYLERDYNCSNFLQSKDRIHRVGLKIDQITNYYYFLSEDSIDLVINKRLDKKVERMLKVIDDDIPLLSRLADDDETDLVQALIKDYDRRNSKV
jgi:SNF2 family DNA or RNA helicase